MHAIDACEGFVHCMHSPLIWISATENTRSALRLLDRYTGSIADPVSSCTLPRLYRYCYPALYMDMIAGPNHCTRDVVTNSPLVLRVAGLDYQVQARRIISLRFLRSLDPA